MTNSSKWLIDPRDAGTPTPPGLPRVSAPRRPDRWIPTAESGDPLQPLADSLASLPVYFRENWPGATSSMIVRREVNLRLHEAQQRLPPNFGLVVLDAWRSLTLQRALFDHYYAGVKELSPGYVSDPADSKWSPPHLTGGAIDITLSWNGAALTLGTDFDSFEEEAWIDALERDDAKEPERSLRRLLTHVLTQAGFCPYSQEWWHFSYGDQLWAFNYGREEAVYGPVEKP